MNAAQDAGQLRHVDAKAACRGGIIADEHQAGCAIRQIIERLRIGLGRVGVVNSLEQYPRRLMGARGARTGDLAVERFETNAVCR